MSKLDKIRENNYSLLETFFIKNGNLTPDTNSELYILISSIRVAIKKGTLPQDYINKLLKIGFIIEPEQEKWKQAISKLKSFIEKNGIANITKKKAPSDIFNFHRHRKEDYRNGKLNDTQISDLLNIGVILDDGTYDKNATKKFNNKSGDNIINKKFNHLLVLRKTNISSQSSSLYYECLCDCGNISLALRNNLKSGKKTTCGKCDYKYNNVGKASQKKHIYSNYVNKKFGNLTILDGEEERVGTKRYWKARCECGNVTKVSTSSLFNSKKLVNSLNCGCINIEQNKKAIKQAVINSYKNTDKGISTAMRKLKANNKSGYIGVHFVNESMSKSGLREPFYQAKLKYEKLIHKIGKYEPTQKGLLEGAIDRDLYIIEKNLPHTRNFSDEELLENIYMFEENRKGFIIEKAKKDFIEILKNKIGIEK